MKWQVYKFLKYRLGLTKASWLWARLTMPRPIKINPDRIDVMDVRYWGKQ